MRRYYPELALHVPTLLLPRSGVPLESWAVIACDQHGAEPDYWEETRRLVADQPSTLHLVLPEAELARAERGAAQAIHRRMADYLRGGVLVERPPGFMRVEREAGRGSPRRGLIVALDLERYDYRAGAARLIRCTEGTDAKRLPPRVATRRGAPLEAPHILVLIDDPGQTVIEPLFHRAAPLAYDFELMQGGGRVRGWHVADAATIDGVADALGALRRGEPPLLYAMGDGNHSFAAARAVWEEAKAAGADADHPARYGLVELVNLHDPAIGFEPIHRLVAGVDPQALFAAMAEHFAAAGFSKRPIGADGWDALGAPGGQRFGTLANGEAAVVEIGRPPDSSASLATATLHDFLDGFLARQPAATLDYVHGAEALASLAARPGHAGFALPTLDKHDLFGIIDRDGATPRKTFSLGAAHEKRYYLECRRLQDGAAP